MLITNVNNPPPGPPKAPHLPDPLKMLLDLVREFVTEGIMTEQNDIRSLDIITDTCQKYGAP